MNHGFFLHPQRISVENLVSDAERRPFDSITPAYRCQSPGLTPPVYFAAMRRSARLVLVCLLLMAIPFKGAVAASMVMCGPGHEGVTAPIATATDEFAGDPSHSQAHDPRSLHHLSSANAMNDDGAGGDDHGSLAKHGATKYGICAACCVGSAILGSADPLMPAFASTEVPFPPLEVLFRSLALSGLERPPRSILV